MFMLQVIYHPLYGMNNYVLIWGDWLSCDPLRWSHDSQSPHKETLVPHLVATLIYLSQKYSYYIRGDRSPLSMYSQISCQQIMCSCYWVQILNHDNTYSYNYAYLNSKSKCDVYIKTHVMHTFCSN